MEVRHKRLARVIELLEREALLTRGPRGRVIEVDWAGCIQLQSLDHTFTRSNTVTALIAPRGHDVVAKLRKARWPYAGTGSLAAQPRSPVASPGRATIYTDHVDPAVYRKAIVFALLADRLDHLTDEARLECLGRLAPTLQAALLQS